MEQYRYVLYEKGKAVDIFASFCSLPLEEQAKHLTVNENAFSALSLFLARQIADRKTQLGLAASDLGRQSQDPQLTM